MSRKKNLCPECGAGFAYLSYASRTVECLKRGCKNFSQSYWDDEKKACGVKEGELLPEHLRQGLAPLGPPTPPSTWMGNLNGASIPAGACKIVVMGGSTSNAWKSWGYFDAPSGYAGCVTLGYAVKTAFRGALRLTGPGGGNIDFDKAYKTQINGRDPLPSECACLSGPLVDQIVVIPGNVYTIYVA